VSEDAIWHILAGLAGVVLSLVVGLAKISIGTRITTISQVINVLTTRTESLAERIARIEGRLNGRDP
jgi:hypothetical protein